MLVMVVDMVVQHWWTFYSFLIHFCSLVSSTCMLAIVVDIANRVVTARDTLAGAFAENFKQYGWSKKWYKSNVHSNNILFKKCSHNI